jgi:Ni/Fe-hydrogenase subunit HybB-like protein
MNDARLTRMLLRPVFEGRAARLLLILSMGPAIFVLSLLYTFVTGIGVFGTNIPVAWAFPITTFVWWIGIGHAGTFISAFLLLFEQRWRSAINRVAEAVTLFALFNAALLPLVHLGRPWFAYWLVPYPSELGVWPQFRSSLTWDIAAITTYFLVSILFWYLGLIPDLATARDSAPSARLRKIYGVFALGWRGSMRQWRAWRACYGLLAGIATPLVVSVHSIVSLDFAIAKLPGWHSTIFPPYFVSGALFSGFAVVIAVLVAIRWMFRLSWVITIDHLDSLAKLLLFSGSVVAYSYFVEHFAAGLDRPSHESELVNQVRPFGGLAPFFWVQMTLNVALPQLLWLKPVRRQPMSLLFVCGGVAVGMWLERWVIVAGSLAHDYLPSSWADFVPSITDGALLLGSLGTFAFLLALFLRFVPFISIAELKLERGQLE